jgi:hypothetical protein
MKLKVRFANELWWDHIPYETALQWRDFEMGWRDDEVSFITVNGTTLEIYTPDLDRLLDDQSFRLKFGLKKHSF